jgi:hypothetical protein
MDAFLNHALHIITAKGTRNVLVMGMFITSCFEACVFCFQYENAKVKLLSCNDLPSICTRTKLLKRSLILVLLSHKHVITTLKRVV